MAPIKYTSEQNLRHFLMAVIAVAGGPASSKPMDCPEYRWQAFMREAKRSLPNISAAVDELARTPMNNTKRITAVVLGGSR